MHLQEQFDRILRSLHEAAFDDGVWPATAGLIDAACGLKGNHLVFGAGSVQWDTRVYFARFCLRGQRRRDLEQWYFREYWFRDERVPRLRELPDGVLVPIRELYAEAERKTSATYNEALPVGCNQDGLNVRLSAPGGARVAWALGDPVEAGGRRSDQIRMMEQLLPHVRHFVSVPTALAEARALGKSFAELLDVRHPCHRLAAPQRVGPACRPAAPRRRHSGREPQRRRRRRGVAHRQRHGPFPEPLGLMHHQRPHPPDQRQLFLPVDEALIGPSRGHARSV